ncbi:MAG: hypothetical protein JEY91_11815 [Spirochaetaceae bacterium]|nr:hypothetical protein [Spirochaetaceae bacterium]
MLNRILFVAHISIIFISCNNFNERIETADLVANQIERMIRTVESDALFTAEKAREYFLYPQKYREGLFPDARYEFYDNVMYHNPEDQGNGKFLYSGYYPVHEKEREKVKILEHVIPDLKWLINESAYSEYLVQSYLITYDTLFVFYPYADLISFIPPERNIQDRTGWKIMNAENNPDRISKWTPPYVDTTGKGFIVDLLYPIDNQDMMEAFLGIDITISTLKNKFFDNVSEKMMLIDKTTSQIMAISDDAVDFLGVENAEAFRYLEMIDNSEIARQVMPDNLVLEKTSSEQMAELWSLLNANKDFSLLIDGKEHRVYRRLIEGPDWFLVLFE